VGWTAYTAEPDALIRGLAASTVLTVRRHGRLVGLARVISDGETIAYLQDLIVDPDHQRHGIGRALLSEALQHFGHCRQFFLTTGVEDPARAFYASMGLVTHDAQGLVAYGAAEVTARPNA
jgi:ribosomal protein S18 acetylase RimI-like enzyme